jgi:hypothetical protein
MALYYLEPVSLVSIFAVQVDLICDLTFLVAFHDIKHNGGRRHLAASACMWIPFYREYLLWLGCVDARREVAEKV